jgi:predicted ABC-class ATPase
VATVVQDLLKELGIEQKLLAITGDNAGNNGTLCDALYKSLSESYSDDPLANSSIRP